MGKTFSGGAGFGDPNVKVSVITNKPFRPVRWGAYDRGQVKMATHYDIQRDARVIYFSYTLPDRRIIAYTAYVEEQDFMVKDAFEAKMRAMHVLQLHEEMAHVALKKEYDLARAESIGERDSQQGGPREGDEVSRDGGFQRNGEFIAWDDSGILRDGPEFKRGGLDDFIRAHKKGFA